MTPDRTRFAFRPLLCVTGVLLIAACGGPTERTGSTDGALSGSVTLLVSTSASRSDAVTLQGANLTGPVYIFTSDATKSTDPGGISKVSYWLDNTAMSGAPTHVEGFGPYDFVGTSGDGSAEPWFTSALAKGSHTITQSVLPMSGALQVSTSNFTVGGASNTYELYVSASSSRGASVPLSGATLTGSEYIFTSDASKSATPSGIAQVSYWLDDTTMTGAATHVEKASPYDYVGTAGDDSAEPLAASSLSAGAHTITQAVTTTSGAVQSSTASFTVGGGSGGGGGGGGGGAGGGGGSMACPSGGIALSSFGSAGKGADDTAVFQNAINSTAGKKQLLHVPVASSSYIIGPITFPSNANVCFDSGVTVEARSGYGEFDIMMSVDGASNVQIMGYGATFHMATSEWSSDPDPEYRHCLAISGSSNVTAGGFTCKTFGGDGVYISGNSANVTVEDVTADGCARDGLTVISAKNSTIKRCHFINGHTGVDMEPNTATDALSGVTLEDSFTTNNNWGGVNVSIYAYDSSTPPLNVTVLRHTDENTGAGVTSFDGATSYSANGANGVALDTSGSLVYDTCTSVNSGSRAAWAAWWTSNGPSVTFKNLTIKNPNQNHNTAVDNAATAIGRGGGGDGDMGNIFFTGTNISSTDGKIDYYFTVYDGSGFPFKNVQWTSPGTLSGATKAPPNGLLNGSGVNSVSE